MGKTNIEWTDYSWNPYKWFCTRVSPGCQHCYMMAQAAFRPQHAADTVVWRPNAWKDLRAIPMGMKVFVNDMSDTFHAEAPTRFIHWIFNAALQRPDLIFQVLTKRIERAFYMRDFLAFPANLWLGTSVESANYTWRIGYLRQIPAAVRFVSFEPLLGDVGVVDLTGIHWAITGAESGGQRRAFDPTWATNILAQCRAYGTAFFHKQGSAFKPGQNRALGGSLYEEYPAGVTHG